MLFCCVLYCGMCIVASFFQAAANYDSVIDDEGFPPSAEDIWILGLAYNISSGGLLFFETWCFVTLLSILGKVWIYQLLFVCFLYVCTVMDFSTEDKASGVTFCMVFFLIFSQRTTLRSLYAISRPSVVCCLSVCLWRWCTLLRRLNFSAIFFSPYDSSGTLLFWCQKSLVGDVPFPLKFSFKMTDPLSNNAISINIGS